MTIDERIAKAQRDCERAFEGVEVGAPVMHCHHERLAELLTEPPQNRIDYIVVEKAKQETPEQIITRLERFRPVDVSKLQTWAAYDKARAAWDKAWAAVVAEITARHDEFCPGCPWDGETIFPEIDDD